VTGTLVAAQWAGHYILPLWFLLSTFFPRLFSAVAHWMSTTLPHMMWPYREFRMQVWNVRHTARWKYRMQKYRHLRTITECCQTVCSQLRHVSTIGKKLINSSISSTCPHNMVNFRPLTAEIDWRVWDTTANFNCFVSWLRYCTNVAERRSTKLCTMFGRLLGWYTIYTFLGALAP